MLMKTYLWKRKKQKQNTITIIALLTLFVFAMMIYQLNLNEWLFYGKRNHIGNWFQLQRYR